MGDEHARASAAGKAATATLGPERTAVKMRAFAERMQKLQRQQAVAPTMSRLGEIATKLKDTRDGSQRSRLADEYRTAASQLPSVERLEALDRLAAL